MSPSDQSNTPSLEQLLDFHLGQLPIEERAAVGRQLAEDTPSARQSKHLADTLRLLDSYKVPPAGERLIQRTLERVAQAGPPARLRYHPPAKAKRAGAPAVGRRTIFSLRDLVAVAASIVLILGIFSPTLSRARAMAHRTMCANRLASLGQGLSSYAQAFDGYLPTAASALWRTPAVQPTPASARPSPRQRAHLYVLVNTRHAMRPKDFLCPANRHAQPMAIHHPDQRTNFPLISNCNYSYQDPSGTRLSIEQYPQFPVLADENPYLLLAPRLIGSWPGDNSRNHPQAAGQNVLRLNGSVRWQDSPWCGVDSRDNIWQHGQWTALEPLDAPAEEPDAYLFP